MATQETRTDNNPNQQSQAKEVTRASQANLTRRAPVPLTLLSPMDLFRVNPFSLMRRMTEEMDRVFGDGRPEQQVSGALWAPAIEVSQQQGNYVVRAELPGLTPEDVRIEVENDALVLQGERKFERDEEQGGVHQTEIRYGGFNRTIPLPEGANAEQARANFENGVLEITIPVLEQKTQRKQISIQTGSTASSNAA